MVANWLSEDSQQCPHSFDCSDKEGYVSFDIGRVPSYLSITSSLLSCFGSLLILLAYFVLKDMRTGAQKVITLLALADFFTAFGYIIGAVNFLTHFNSTSETGCKVFSNICEIQSYITTWSTMCSFCWTCILAFYFCLVLVFRNQALAARLIPLYNVIAWIGPLLIIFPLLVGGKLGYAPYVASNWCYIRDEDYHVNLDQKSDTVAYILIAGKLWEVITYVFIVVLYAIISVKLRKTQTRVQAKGSPKVETVEKRLLAIPLLYIFLRIWGTLQFFYSLIVAHTNMDGCIPKAVQMIFLAFGITQAIGDGGQGWCNAILYIFFSQTTRQRLFLYPLDKCLAATENKLQKLLTSETEQRNNRNLRQSEDIQSVEPSNINETPSGSPVLPSAASATGYKISNYDSSYRDSMNTTATDASNSVLYSSTKRVASTQD